MDIIELTRKLGAEIQNHEAYKNFANARIAADSDAELQEKIGDFNLLKMQLDAEKQKEDADKAKIDSINEDIVTLYNEISTHEKMKAYFAAMNDYKALTDRIMNILYMCQNGEDPATCEPASSCTGNCSSCGGCN